MQNLATRHPIVKTGQRGSGKPSQMTVHIALGWECRHRSRYPRSDRHSLRVLGGGRGLGGVARKADVSLEEEGLTPSYTIQRRKHSAERWSSYIASLYLTTVHGRMIIAGVNGRMHWPPSSLIAGGMIGKFSLLAFVRQGACRTVGPMKTMGYEYGPPGPSERSRVPR
jgi:hypothetical protein